MGVDRAAVHRADRIRGLVVLVSLTASGLGFFELSMGAPPTRSFLLGAALGTTGMIAAFLGGMSFFSVVFWSDLLIATYEATLPDANTPIPMADRRAAYRVTLTVGRAQSRNQWGPTGGRALVTIVNTPALDDVRERLIAGLRGL